MYRQQQQPRNRSVARADLRNGPFFPAVQNVAHQSSQFRGMVWLLQISSLRKIHRTFVAVARIAAGTNHAQSGKSLEQFIGRSRSAQILFVRQRIAWFWRGWVYDNAGLI